MPRSAPTSRLGHRLDPEGGNAGGQIIATGPPELIAANPASHTGHYLTPILG